MLPTTPPAQARRSERVLDPIARNSELLFGLIMASLSVDSLLTIRRVHEAGSADHGRRVPRARPGSDFDRAWRVRRTGLAYD